MTDQEKIAVMDEYRSFCNGTDEYHQYNNFISSANITDGIKLMADTYDAYWFLDLILSYQTREWKKRHPPMDYPLQYWFLKKNEGKDSCTVWMEYIEGIPAIKQEIEYTDFPEQEFKMKFNAYDLVMCLYEED
jgi:hypothetical protein